LLSVNKLHMGCTKAPACNRPYDYWFNKTRLRQSTDRPTQSRVGLVEKKSWTYRLKPSGR
jgi:hypothetical protein